jgi:carbamoyl-phosphate synthase large subunit
MNRLGIEMPRSRRLIRLRKPSRSPVLGYPVVIRPPIPWAGRRRLVYNIEELRVIAARGIAASLVGQILVEESFWAGRNSNWKWCGTPKPDDHRSAL